MQNYLVTVIYAGSYNEQRVDAASAEQAVALVTEMLAPKFRRWANVFVG
jgi:hypothetical protein